MERTSDGTGKVSDYTVEELKEFNYGIGFGKMVSISTLEEFLCYCKAHHVVAELDLAGKIDTEEKMKIICESISSNGMRKNTIITALPGELTMTDMSSEFIVCISGIIDEEEIVDAKNIFDRFDTVICSIPFENYSDTLADICRDRGCKVKVWTVNDKDIIEELFKGSCDYIITDEIEEADLKYNNG